jgi:hypothetical protein
MVTMVFIGNVSSTLVVKSECIKKKWIVSFSSETSPVSFYDHAIDSAPLESSVSFGGVCKPGMSSHQISSVVSDLDLRQVGRGDIHQGRQKSDSFRRVGGS